MNKPKKRKVSPLVPAQEKVEETDQSEDDHLDAACDPTSQSPVSACVVGGAAEGHLSRGFSLSRNTRAQEDGTVAVSPVVSDNSNRF